MPECSAALPRRYCSADAYFCVKEVDLAITADMGTLQRLPRIVGAGAMPTLHYTNNDCDGVHASACNIPSSPRYVTLQLRGCHLKGGHDAAWHVLTAVACLTPARCHQVPITTCALGRRRGG